jgi:hypothetical protein
MNNLKRIASVFILMRRIALVFLLLALATGGLSVQAQQRRSSRRSASNRPDLRSYRLTGTYRLDTTRGDDARAMADRATINLPQGQRERVQDNVMGRLEAPDMLAIEQNGRTVSIASSRAARITFDADGQERSEVVGNGRTLRTRATLNGDRLEVSTLGNRSSDFSVTFESLDNGRSLRVTRRIYSDRLDQPIVVQSFYDRTSDIAQWNIYDGQQTYPGTRAETTSTNFIVRDGTRLVAVLNNDLSTRQTRERDPFTLTVREPAEYAGATINGYVSQVSQSGKVTGRSGMTLNFETIQLRNGRTYSFAGLVNSVRTQNGETVRVDNEGSVESSNQTEKTGVRTAIGTGVGAIIGAIAGGGKGAAIGAIVGAGAGAGSVYVQGRENLELRSGTELTLQASSPNNNNR